MDRISFCALLTAATIVFSCGSSDNTSVGNCDDNVINPMTRAEGDSTIYGLACDGCTDSVLVFLPYSGGDPDTFDIIEARRQHRVFGRPHVGDELAVILSDSSATVADMVVNLNELRKSWCYRVMPVLRRNSQVSEKSQKEILARMPDSVRSKLFVPREYGFKLKRENSATVIGFVPDTKTTDEKGFVEYPPLKWYNEWSIFNGYLILTQNTTKMMVSDENKKIENDTAEIVLLRRDTLVLRFKDHEQSYYAKE